MFEGVASSLLLVGFPLLAVVLIGLVAVAHRWAARRVGVPGPVAARRTVAFVGVALGWQALVSALAVTGVLSAFEVRPPPVLLLLFGVAGGAQWLARSPVGEVLQRGLPLAALVGFHAFRLPLEVLMHQAAAEGVMPPQMTWTGLNLDVVTGVTALVVAALVHLGLAGRRLVLAWNALGTLLLVVVVTVAVASTPVFAAFGGGPRLNTFIAFVPFSTLPTVMVLLAMAGHVVLWRRLRAERSAASGPAPAPVTGS